MKTVIEKKVYNTETAEKIADKWNGLDRGNFRFELETIYKTKKGQFFLHSEGGAMSSYSERFGDGSSSPGENIRLLSENNVIELLEKWGEVTILETHFSKAIQEG